MITVVTLVTSSERHSGNLKAFLTALMLRFHTNSPVVLKILIIERALKKRASAMSEENLGWRRFPTGVQNRW